MLGLGTRTQLVQILKALRPMPPTRERGVDWSSKSMSGMAMAKAMAMAPWVQKLNKQIERTIITIPARSNLRDTNPNGLGWCHRAGLIMIPLPPTLPSPPSLFGFFWGSFWRSFWGSFMVVLEVVLEVVSDVVLE